MQEYGSGTHPGQETKGNTFKHTLSEKRIYFRLLGLNKHSFSWNIIGYNVNSHNQKLSLQTSPWHKNEVMQIAFLSCGRQSMKMYLVQILLCWPSVPVIERDVLLSPISKIKGMLNLPKSTFRKWRKKRQSEGEGDFLWKGCLMSSGF